MQEAQDPIYRLQQGDKAALSAVYDAYSAALFGVVVRICNDRGLAEDVLQEVFVKIWKHIDTYDPEKGKFYTWAYRIARNTSLNAVRKQKQLIQTNDLSVYKERNEESDSYLDKPLLKGAIAQLEPHHRKAIELIYYQGLTHREAYKIMEVPLGTFKSYIQQALKQLRSLYPMLHSFWVLLIERMML